MIGIFLKYERVWLDLYDKGISLKFANYVFDIEKITNTRSLSFTIPATAKNQGAFEYGNDLRLYGGFRRSKSCVLYIEGLQVGEGNMFLISANEKEYNVSFVLANGFEKIKDCKNIKEYAQANGLFMGLNLFDSTPKNAWNTRNNGLDELYYDANYSPLFPCIKEEWLLEMIMPSFGLSYYQYTLNIYLWHTCKIENQKTSGVLRSIGWGEDEPDWDDWSSRGMWSTIEFTNSAFNAFISKTWVSKRPYYYYGCSCYEKGGTGYEECGCGRSEEGADDQFEMLRTSVELTLKFGDNAVYEQLSIRRDDFSVIKQNLRKATVTIPANQIFCIWQDIFYQRESYSPQQDTCLGSHERCGDYTYGFYPVRNATASFECEYKIEPGRQYLQQSLLPTCSLLDIINLVGFYAGKTPKIENNVLTYVDFQPDYSQAITLKNILKVDKIERKFLNYKQKNSVGYEDGFGSVYFEQENDYLEKKGTLFKCPFDHSERAYDNLYCTDKSKEYLGVCVQNQAKLQVAKFTKKNAFLESFFNASTQVSVTCVMDWLELKGIVNDGYKLINFQGQIFAWSEANYNTETRQATFLLHKCT